jgi:hypothetical protein
MFRKYDIEGSVGIIYHCGGFYTTDIRAEQARKWQHRTTPEGSEPIHRAPKSFSEIDHDAGLRLCPRGTKVYTAEVDINDITKKPAA